MRTLFAALYAGGSGGVLCLLEVLEVMHCVPRCILEAVEVRLPLLEAPEAMRYMLLHVLEVVKDVWRTRLHSDWNSTFPLALLAQFNTLLFTHYYLRTRILYAENNRSCDMYMLWSNSTA